MYSGAVNNHKQRVSHIHMQIRTKIQDKLRVYLF